MTSIAAQSNGFNRRLKRDGKFIVDNVNHIKKTIAPIIVSLCLIGYYLSVGFVLLRFGIPSIIKIAVLIVSIIGTVVIIMVLIERLKEIKGGEEDDLGNY